jgi:acetyl esterase/lipase
MARWTLLLPALVVAVAGLRAGEPRQSTFERKQDVIYGRKHGLCLTMDVFTPRGERNGIGVIAVVSGGWHSSHDEIGGAQDFGYELIKRGYTVFAVVHGSQPKFSIPECIDDIHRSVRFIRHNARDFGVDPARIGISGASAGCHLALMIAVAPREGNPKSRDAVERESSQVQAVAGFFPPTDFFNYGAEGRSAEGLIRAGPFSPAFDFRERELLTNNWKPVSDSKRKEILKQISPIYHVTPRSPPTLLIHGDKDILVPLQQSQSMMQKLKSANVPCDLVVHAGGGHGWDGIEKDLVRVGDWFDTYLLPKK